MSGTDTHATLTAVVTDESGASISGLTSAAFTTTVDENKTVVDFAESATAGTYTGTLALLNVNSGTHNLAVNVTDTRSVLGTGSASFSVQTASNATIVSVTAIGYATTGGRFNDKHLNISVEVDDNLGSNVSGASVSIELSRDGAPIGSATAMSDTSGKVTFTYNNAPSGTYTTQVTNVTAAGLTWDGSTPANSFAK